MDVEHFRKRVDKRRIEQMHPSQQQHKLRFELRDRIAQERIVRARDCSLRCHGSTIAGMPARLRPLERKGAGLIADQRRKIQRQAARDAIDHRLKIRAAARREHDGAHRAGVKLRGS